MRGTHKIVGIFLPVAAVVGHGLRRLGAAVLRATEHVVHGCSPTHAFAAGLAVNVAVAGGYALAVVSGGGVLGVVEGVRMVQLATLGAAGWGLGWMLMHQCLRARAVGFVLPASASLLAWQTALAVGGNLFLLGLAVALRGNVLVQPETWTLEAGSPLGVAALLVGLATLAVWHGQRQQPLAWQTPFFVGLTLPVLFACVVERALPAAGYRALLLAWPGYVLAWSLAALAPRVRQRVLRGVAFDDGELPWAVGLVSSFTLLVATKVVWLLEDYLPVVCAGVLTALAFAALALNARKTRRPEAAG